MNFRPYLEKSTIIVYKTLSLILGIMVLKFLKMNLGIHLKKLTFNYKSFFKNNFIYFMLGYYISLGMP